MPILNETNGTISPFTVRDARTFFPRLVGLLGRAEADEAVHFVPCSSIHTFGMQAPIDVLFLHADGTVLRLVSRLVPNRIVRAVPAAISVLELPAGAIRRLDIRKGDRLRIVPDGVLRPDFRAVSHLLHWPVNLFIGLLWSRFVLAAFNSWTVHAVPLNLGILIHNTLLMYFFLVRRNSTLISHRIADWLVPILTMCGAMLLRPTDANDPSLATFSVWIQGIGMAGIVYSLFSLGRSFGIVPANRTVVCTGAYRTVRHPLYVSELIFYTGFLCGNPSFKNLVLVMLVSAGQLWRSISEERLLALDPSYKKYMHRVRFRFIPGVF